MNEQWLNAFLLIRSTPASASGYGRELSRTVG
jgi:hypothetical protein